METATDVQDEQAASKLYDVEYYQTGCGPVPYERNDHWLWFFSSVADQVVRSLKPQRVLDAGCALGMLVEAFWDRGVEAWGVDISEYAIAHVRRDMQQFCRVGSVLEELNPPGFSGAFDLVTCIEVLEHLSPADVRGAVEQLSRLADTILFSSTPSDFAEPTHFCVRPAIFWLKLFAEFGYSPDLLFDASFLAPHAMLLRRQTPQTGEVLAAFADRVRLRVALVEREARIGKMGAKEHDLEERLNRTGEELGRFIATNQQMSEVIDGTAASIRRFQEENAALSGHVADLQIANEQLESEERRLRAANEQLESEEHRLRALNEQLAAESHAKFEMEQSSAADNERLALTLSELTRDHLELREQFSEASRAVAELDATTRAQRSELLAVHSSPGWSWILRYRDWLAEMKDRPAAVRWLHDTAVRLALRRTGAMVPHIAPEVPGQAMPPVPYAIWLERNAAGVAGMDLQRELARNLGYRPLISVLVPVFKVPVQVVREMVQSVVSQSYSNWELCIVHADAPDRGVADLLADYSRGERRIKVRTLGENLGISGNSNEALQLAQGEFLALLDHDDVLAPSALFEMARALNEDASYDFLYSDKDQLEEGSGRRLAPLFKPQWSPEIMLSANYLTHLCLMRTSRVLEVGGWRAETDGAQDWDLFLRVIQRGGKVRHIPKVLYHWRRIVTSVALGGLAAKPYVTEAQRRCLQDYLSEMGWEGQPVPLASGYWKIAWNPARRAAVSIICLHAPDHPEAAADWAARLKAATRYPDFEVVFPVPNAPASGERALRFVEVSRDASPAQRIDEAAKSCLSPWLVFLDTKVQPLDQDWLEELTGPLSCAGIGLVAPKLLDPATMHIRHAGICFNATGELDYIFSNQPEHVYNEFGGANWYRNWTAISGACFAMRRADWNAAGGFSKPLEYPRFDIDLCLRVRLEQGLRLTYNPFARLTQSGTCALEEWQALPQAGATYIRACYPEGDPYFNPNLSSVNGAVELGNMKPGAHKHPQNARAEDRSLVAAFDFTANDVAVSRAATAKPGTGKFRRCVWILPDFTVAFYGGVHTILRFADSFFRKHGVHSDFVFLSGTHEAILRERIGKAFPELAADCGVFRIRGYADLEKVPESDCTICTLWTTAYTALFLNHTRRKFYFMQDYEPLFYAAGSVSALAEATYGFGYTGLCNTLELKKLYREHGSEAEYFEPSVDTSIFFAGSRSPGRRPYRLFCYARPMHTRNCFELLASALRKLKDRFGDELQIITAGSDWDANEEGLGGVIENLGILGYRETAALYRSCDAGTVMMMTAHPSYLPLELMACGALVVTNANHSTSWLLRDNDNCLLSAPSAGSFAARIEEGLRNTELRERVTGNALAMVREKYGDWDVPAEKIYQYMLASS